MASSRLNRFLSLRNVFLPLWFQPGEKYPALWSTLGASAKRGGQGTQQPSIGSNNRFDIMENRHCRTAIRLDVEQLEAWSPALTACSAVYSDKRHGKMLSLIAQLLCPQSCV